MAATFDPTSVDLTANNTDLQRQVTCFFQLGKPDYDGHEGMSPCTFISLHPAQ